MKNNGGAAFPSAVGDIGMSLRDWFAGQALAGLVANPRDQELDGERSTSKIAYILADAMLAERAKE